MDDMGNPYATLLFALIGLALTGSALWSNRKKATNSEFDRQRKLLEAAEARERQVDRDARQWRRLYELWRSYAMRLRRALEQSTDIPENLRDLPPDDVDDED